MAQLLIYETEILLSRWSYDLLLLLKLLELLMLLSIQSIAQR